MKNLYNPIHCTTITMTLEQLSSVMVPMATILVTHKQPVEFSLISRCTL